MRNTLFLLLMLISALANGQTTITGNVQDVRGAFIANASVLVKDENNHIRHYGFTNKEGGFSIAVESTGTFVVEVKKIGFIRHSEPLTVTSDEKKYTLDFVLDDVSEEIEEVVIHIDNPIQLRGDTLIFDAKAWATGREQVVEDLLKNIPGVEVLKNGKIKFEGQYIEKVMVGGDDFFNQGYTLLTKNMPNKPLDKVEILRNYSNNKLLKGIEDSKKVAINLTIDEEYKEIWFGDLEFGYDLDSKKKYDVVGNLMNFSDLYKNFLNVGSNNVGINRVGSLRDMFFNNYEIESIGRGKSLYPLVGSEGERVPQLKDHRTRINDAQNISLSSIIPVSEKFKVNLSGFLGADKSYAFKDYHSVTDVGSTYFENNEYKHFNRFIRSGYINALVTYNVSDTQMIQASSIYTFGRENFTNNLNFNGVSTLENLETQNSFTDNKITITKKWKNNSVVLLKTRFFSNDLPQKYHIDDYLMGDLFGLDVQSVQSTVKNGKTYFGTEADFRFKQKSNNKIDFQLGYEYEQQHLQSNFVLFHQENEFYPEEYQSKGAFGLHDFYTKGGYLLDFKEIKLRTSAEVHQMLNRFSNTRGDKNQNFFFVNPSLNFTWDIKPSHTLSASYSLRFSNSTNFVEINDTYLFISSRNFRKGLGSFRLTDHQMASLGYDIRHYLNRYLISFGLNYSTQHKVLSSRSTLEQNSSLSENILINGGEIYGILIKTNYYWKKFKSNFKLEINKNISVSYNEINNSGLRKNIFQSNRYNFEWSTRLKIPVNFHIGTEWQLTSVESPTSLYRYTNKFSFLDVFLTTNSKWSGKMIVEHYHFGNLDKSQRNHIFMDVEATYKIQNDKYEFSLRANNLFNKQEFSTFSISDTGYSRTSYRLMPRYVLLGFKTRFHL